MQHERENQTEETVYRTSFILRCWHRANGEARFVLIDVHSGVAHPVAALAQLPAVLEKVLTDCLGAPQPVI